MNEPELKIEKGIPMPPRKDCSGMTGLMRSMEVGDSILIKPSARNAAGSCARLAGIKVSVRMVEGGLRVWRVA